jgi:hypothetical protein
MCGLFHFRGGTNEGSLIMSKRVKATCGPLDFKTARQIIHFGGSDDYALPHRRAGVRLAAHTLLRQWPVFPQGDEEIGFEVVLYTTPIIRFWADGRVALSAGKWRTQTTLNRLNQFQRVAQVCRCRGLWWIDTELGNWPFIDGITVRDGTIDVLSTFRITGCPIGWDYPGIAADWLEENGRERDANRIRRYVREAGWPAVA